MWAEWQAAAPGARDAFDMQQLRNASCLCANGTAPLAGTAGFASEAAYLASNCSGASELRYRQLNASTNQTDELLASGQALADLCAATVSTLAKGRSNMTSFVQRALVDRRLGDGRLTGKIAARNSVLNALQRYMQVGSAGRAARRAGLAACGPGQGCSVACILALQGWPRSLCPAQIGPA